MCLQHRPGKGIEAGSAIEKAHNSAGWIALAFAFLVAVFTLLIGSADALASFWVSFDNKMDQSQLIPSRRLPDSLLLPKVFLS